MSDDARIALRKAAEARGESLAGLSRLLRRNPAYIQQFVRRGSPRRLPEAERRVLASYLGVSEESLGGPPDRGGVPVRRLDVRVSAGPGALSETEAVRGVAHFPAELIASLGLAGRPLSMVVARGDSMLPTIADGDEVLVDGSDRRPGARAAIYVLRRDGTLAVKRLRLARGAVEIVSDNPAYPAERVPAEAVEVIGRVVWLARTL